ncbi:hypothetical protein DRQ26_04775, partial [bacterium]
SIDTSSNPCTLAVSAPGTVIALWDTLVWAVVLSEPPGGEILVDSAAASPWANWISIYDSLYVSAQSPCSAGIDSQLVFYFWSDSGAQNHCAKFTEPDTLRAYYLWQFLCHLEKNPLNAAGWLAMDSDTTLDSISKWIFKDSTFFVSASDTSYDFMGMTTWVFDSFSDGMDTSHFVDTIAEPITISANFLGEEMFIDISFAGDSNWHIDDTLDAGDTVFTSIGEEIFILNNGNAPLDFGLSSISAEDSLWLPDTVQNSFRFILRARFDTICPSSFDVTDDFVDTTLFWADSCRFGDGGWNICPQENVPLWFWFAAPTYYRYTDEQWLKIGVSGKISIP